MSNIESPTGGICIENKCSDCCRGKKPGVLIPLTKREADFLKETGTIIAPDIIDYSPGGIPQFRKTEEGLIVYLMIDPCSQLNKNGLCDAINNPNRPQACKNTIPGGQNCSDCRSDNGHPPIIPINSITVRTK